MKNMVGFVRWFKRYNEFIINKKNANLWEFYRDGGYIKEQYRCFKEEIEKFNKRGCLCQFFLQEGRLNLNNIRSMIKIRDKTEENDDFDVAGEIRYINGGFVSWGSS